MTLNERLAAYLRERPNRWLDGLELSRVAGSYAWRTRISVLRRPPYGLTIENRVRVVKSPSHRDQYRVSEYRLVP